MRKLIFSVVAIAMLASCALFAQDEAPAVKRTINGYLQADSGDILGSSGVDEFDEDKGVFDGHEMEMGVSYSQNFASVQWLTIRVRMNAVVTSTEIFADNLGGLDQYLGGTRASVGTGGIRGQVRLNANGSGFGVNGLNLNVALDTRTKMDAYATYGMAVGPGRLTFGLGTEIYLVPRVYLDGSEVSTNSNNAWLSGDAWQYHMDLFVISAAYAMKFNDVWGLNTAAYARFTGYDIEDAGFADNLEIRLEAYATASFKGGLGMWAGVRFDIEDLCLPEERNREEGVNMDLKLRAGVSYTFDI